MRRICLFFLGALFTLSSGFAQIITTVAGTGTAGYSGDGGPATQAHLNQANGVGVDGSGNLYISDPQNNRIRKVSSWGVITTVVGNGSPGSPDSLSKGGVATQLAVTPAFFTVGRDGTIYFFDLLIKKVDLSGNLTGRVWSRA